MIPFDQYQRYKNTELIINNIRDNEESLRILEVGANTHRNLEKFLPEDEVVYLDIVVPDELLILPNYIKGDATAMIFEDNSFDVIVALDVFEHIPKEKREAFIMELYRVSKIAFIVSAPFASIEVKLGENNCNNLFKLLYGKEHVWLSEHEDCELPNYQEWLEFLERKNIKYESFSHGHIGLWEKLLNLDFVASIDESLQVKRDKIHKYYNDKLFEKDYGGDSYRKFIVGKKIEKPLSDFSDKNLGDICVIDLLESEFYEDAFYILENRKKEIIDETSTIYVDSGAGYGDIQIRTIPEQQGNSNVFIIDIKLQNECERFRFDPIEGVYCIIRNLKVYIEGQLIESSIINGNRVVDTDIFLTYDPQYEIKFNARNSNVRISFERYILGSNEELLYSILDEFIKVTRKFHENYNLIEQKNQEIECKNEEIDNGYQTIKTNNITINELCCRVEELRIAYESICQSKCWKLTKPIRIIVKKIKKN